MPRKKQVKIKYEFDPDHRLIAKSELLGIRRILEGEFKVDAQNNLLYEIKTPIPEDIKAPHKIKLKGNWSLTDEHKLCFTLDKWKRSTFGDQITLEGEILDVKKNALLFGVTSRNQKGNLSIYALELSGNWQVDEDNRIIFRVVKAKDKFDTLIFSGAWQIDKNYQIIYQYTQEDRQRKIKRIKTLTFKGSWDILDKKRLSYVIEKSSDSIFNFKTSLGVFKENYIKYELGIGISKKRRPLRRVITFFGQWKIKENLGLIFEMERGKKIEAFVFGAEAKLTKNNTILFNLRNRLNQSLETSLELSHTIFKNKAQAFLRLLSKQRELTIQVGLGWQW